MALGRNHKIFNIGNASGTIQGLTRVYHDLTLSGDGTLSSLLGVVGDKADEEVNQYVYDNSATIDEVNTSYQTNSGNFLTAIPDYYATTGDINDLAQSISENYQVKGDYAERDFVLSSIESSTSGKLDTSSFASVSSDFLVSSSLNGYATESFVEETSGAITSLIPTNYYPDTNPSSFVNEDWVTAQGYITGVDLTPYQTTAGMTAYATTGDVANKLDTTSFSNVSSTFLTAHQIIPSAKWENTSDVVQSNSAQWSENTGDEEVNSFVYNNSATINEVNTAYQTHSASYQPSGNYIPYTGYSASLGYVTNSSFSIHDGSFTNTLNRGSLVIQNRITSNIYSNMAAGPASISFSTPSDSAKVDLPSINKWNEVSTTVQTNSSNWDNVANKLDTTSFSNVSGTFLTAHQDLSNYYTKSETSGADELANAFANIPAGDSEVNSYVHDTSATIDEVNSTVQSNSATWGQGGGSTSGLVSGTNVVKVPLWEGATQGEYWSACISGDVKVATGHYRNETEFDEGPVYSLSAIGDVIGDKLNKNTIEDSKTIKRFNDVFEVYDVAYKRTNFTNGSARSIDFVDYEDGADIDFNADDIVNNSNLYSASVVAETTATGNFSYNQGEWKIVDFSNGSALLTALYPAGIRGGYVSLHGWGKVTNCEATCTVYTSAELAPIAFKDDIPSGGGGVPQSAFDELKQSYATLSSLFATYSGQWLLPNEGV